MMNKMIAGAVLIAVFGLSVYFYASNRQAAAPGTGDSPGIQSQIDATDKQDPSIQMPPEEMTVELPASEQQARMEQQKKELLRQQSMQAAAVRQEIDALIVELDDNLSDPDQRKVLKQRINRKMAEYNQYVLPVAVNAMQEQPQ